MFHCVECKTRLETNKGPLGVIWFCPACGSRAATIAFLRKHVPQPVVNSIWQKARSPDAIYQRSCPGCDAQMAEVGLEGYAPLDVCTRCHFIWFDPGEHEALPEVQHKAPQKEVLSQQAREAVALAKLESIREEAMGSDWGNNSPEETWKWIPALLGMPVEHEEHYYSRLPLVTWALAVLISIVSVWAFSDSQTIQQYGLIPAEVWRYGGLTLITSFFLHVGIVHLIGNLYFFIIFGDNVEDYLGHFRFAMLLVLASLAGDWAHILADPDSRTPCVGASGGISGVIAYYALKFPQVRLGFMLWFRWFRFPAYFMFILWIGLQLFGTWQQQIGVSNVSAVAHLGGAIVGGMFWWFTRNE
jgi:membrane associated rhomboid family serine protease